ncbi:LuxR C-terminal-related transcriptional regulator, partial [Ramlibacter humi]
AAQAEPNPIRAIGHRLDAEQWEQAAADIVANGQALISQGAWRALVRSITRLPREVLDRDPELWLMLASSAWSNGDMIEVRHCLRRAAALCRGREDVDGESRINLLMLPPLVMLGDLTSAERVLEWCESRVPTDARQRKLLPLARMWHDLTTGDAASMSRNFEALANLVRSEDADLLFAWLSRSGGGLRGSIVGFRGWHSFFYEFEDAVMSGPIAELESHPVRTMTLTLRAWRLLWTGDLLEARAAIDFAEETQRRTGSSRGTAVDLSHADMLLRAVAGDAAGSEASGRSMLALIESCRGIREAFTPVYLLLQARACWILGRFTEMEEACRQAFTADFSNTPPYFEGALHLTQAYCAVARGDLATATKELAAATRIQARMPVAAFYGDATLVRAYVHLLAGEQEQAATLFSDVLDRVDADSSLGLLIVERRDIVDALFRVLPSASQPHHAAQRLQLAVRRAHGGLQQATQAAARREVQLSARELEVLQLVASGASNKIIARKLLLSVHTVKRHLANITGKLGVGGRIEAAAAFRHSQPAPP